MSKFSSTDAVGEMVLLTRPDETSKAPTRVLLLQASDDGKTVVMVDVDSQRVGVQREYRYETTTRRPDSTHPGP